VGWWGGPPTPHPQIPNPQSPINNYKCELIVINTNFYNSSPNIIIKNNT
jgi:hypothetical protein